MILMNTLQEENKIQTQLQIHLILGIRTKK
jgi:hypothetical protein